MGLFPIRCRAPLAFRLVTRESSVFFFPSTLLNITCSFFGNHAAVISVFLASGIAIACAAVLALYYCRRRREKAQRSRRRLQDISPPFNFFTTRGDMKTYGSSSDQITSMQNTISFPLNRSGDSLPAAHSKIDLSLPRPVAQRPSRSSYRVPVPYSPVQSVPPPLPERSPLRLLAAKNSLNTSLEDPNRLSQASSLSLYPPSPSTFDSEAVVASENNPGADYGRKKTGKYTQAPGLNSVDLGGASSSWRAQHSLVESPALGRGPVQSRGPMQSSILGEVYRLAQVQRAPLARYKVGQ